jgi:phosphotriesterase-related protein
MTMTRREALSLLGTAGAGGALAGTGLLARVDGASATTAIGATPSAAVTAGPASAGAASTRRLQASGIIRTLQGDVAPGALPDGAVLFHEHLSIQLGANPSFHSDVGMMTAEVRAAAADGVALIVDGGHADMGRDMAALRTIATESEVPIVASGGYYMQRTYPADIATRSAAQIADDLVAEARRDRHGAFGEIGQQGGVLTADERKVHEAVALAHVRTGIPVFTHNPSNIRLPDVPREAALLQLDIYQAAGANLGNVCIGHVCCLDDPEAEIASELARRGAYVGFDRVTLNGTMPDENRVVMAMALVRAGHADRLLLSSDFYSQPALKANGGPGLAQTATVFGAMLRDAGLDAATLRMILEENPKRFLAFEPRA